MNDETQHGNYRTVSRRPNDFASHRDPAENRPRVAIIGVHGGAGDIKPKNTARNERKAKSEHGKSGQLNISLQAAKFPTSQVPPKQHKILDH